MIKIFIIASNLGNINRGYEASLHECFQVFKEQPDLNILLLKGNGERNSRELVVPNISSASKLAFQLGKLTGKGENSPGIIHSLSYFPGLLPYLEFHKPDIIYLSEGPLGKLLFYWRKIRSLNYKIIFRNGGPMLPPYFYADLVQHLTPIHYKIAIDFGESPHKHIILSTGFKLPQTLHVCSKEEIISLRSQLKLPADKKIILSVAAINKHHKRIDYLIREVHALGNPDLCLVALGHHDLESKELIRLGYTLLGQENFIVRSIPREQVDDYYKVADLFVLTSLKEGLARVQVEAMSYGLPCLSHNSEVSRYVLGEYGYYGDFRQSGELTALLTQCLSPDFKVEKSKSFERSKFVYDRFSWDKLSEKYLQMFHRGLD